MPDESFEVSASERVDRLRAQLQGRPFGPVRTARTATTSPGAGLLYGVMLRGAARLDAGLELTDLETGMLDFLRAMLSEEEVREFGRVYREEETAVGASSLFPDTLTTRALKDGYAFADLVRDMPDLRGTAGSQSNVSVVDLDRPGTDASADGADFTRGVREHGWGLTFVTASEHRPGVGTRAEPLNPPERVRVELDRFKCYRDSDELGPDEIYWAVAAGTDTGDKNTLISRVHRNIGPNDVVDFDPGTVPFDGTAADFLTMDIICWEEDHSPQRWYEEMQNTLSTIAGLLQLMAEKLKEFGGHFPVPEYHDLIDYVEIANMIVLAIGGLVKLFTNHDDLVHERALVVDRAALTAWAGTQHATTSWDFDGKDEGHYILVAKCGFPSRDRLYVTTLPGSQTPVPWTRGVEIPGGGLTTAPALAWYPTSTGTRLYCMTAGANGEGGLYWRSYDGTTWTGWTGVPGARTTHSPALVEWRGLLYCAYTDGDKLWLRTFDGTTWAAPTLLASGPVQGAPALGGWGTGLYVAARNHQNKLIIDRYGNNAWNGFVTYSSPATISDSPAFGTGEGGVLHLLVRSGSTMYWARKTDLDFDPRPIPGGPDVSGTAALGASFGRTYCVVSGAGQAKELLYSVLDRNTGAWGPFTRHPTAASASAPALANGMFPNDPQAPHGRLYLVYRN